MFKTSVSTPANSLIAHIKIKQVPIAVSVDEWSESNLGLKK